MAAKQADLVHGLVGAAILQFRRAVGRQQDQRSARPYPPRPPPAPNWRSPSRRSRSAPRAAFPPWRDRGAKKPADRSSTTTWVWRTGWRMRRQGQGRRARARRGDDSSQAGGGQAVEQRGGPAKAAVPPSLRHHALPSSRRSRFAILSPVSLHSSSASDSAMIPAPAHSRASRPAQESRAQHDRRLAVAVEIDPAGEAGVEAVARAARLPLSQSRAAIVWKAEHGGRRMQAVDRIEQIEARPQRPATGVHKCCKPRSRMTSGAGARLTSLQISRKSTGDGTARRFRVRAALSARRA